MHNQIILKKFWFSNPYEYKCDYKRITTEENYSLDAAHRGAPMWSLGATWWPRAACRWPPGLEGALKWIHVGQQTKAALHEEELSVSLCWPFVDKRFTGVKIFHSNEGFASRVTRQREALSRTSQQRECWFWNESGWEDFTELEDQTAPRRSFSCPQQTQMQLHTWKSAPAPPASQRKLGPPTWHLHAGHVLFKWLHVCSGAFQNTLTCDGAAICIKSPQNAK